MPAKNLAVELLERLIKDEIRSRSRNNVVRESKYGERLAETLRKYNNRTIESSKIVEELIAMAKDFIAAVERDEDLGLSPDEIAFYDALADRPEVLRQMGDETLKKLAGARERAGEDAAADQTPAAEVQIPAGGARGGGGACDRAGGAA